MYPIEMSKAGKMFLLNSLNIGGSERKIVRLANILHKRGARVIVAYLNDPDTLGSEVLDGIPVVMLDRKGKYDRQLAGRIMNLVEKYEIEDIFCINLYPLLYALPVVQRSGQKALNLAVCINTTDIIGIREKLRMLLYTPLIRKVEKVVFGCNYQRRVWSKRYNLSPEFSTVIYNGVDTDHFSIQPVNIYELDILSGIRTSDDEIIIGMIAQMRPEKGYRDALMAMRKLLDEQIPLKFVIVGDGPEYANITRMIDKADLSGNVIMLGQLPDVRPVLVMLDVFLLTSIAVETFSNAALEAMSMGKPVILSDIGGAAELVGDAGKLYPAGDVDKLVECIRSFIFNQEDRLDAGKRARKRVVECFSIDKMADDYANLFSR